MDANVLWSSAPHVVPAQRMAATWVAGLLVARRGRDGSFLETEPEIWDDQGDADEDEWIDEEPSQEGTSEGDPTPAWTEITWETLGAGVPLVGVAPIGPDTSRSVAAATSAEARARLASRLRTEVKELRALHHRGTVAAVLAYARRHAPLVPTFLGFTAPPQCTDIDVEYVLDPDRGLMTVVGEPRPRRPYDSSGGDALHFAAWADEHGYADAAAYTRECVQVAASPRRWWMGSRVSTPLILYLWASEMVDRLVRETSQGTLSPPVREWFDARLNEVKLQLAPGTDALRILATTRVAYLAVNAARLGRGGLFEMRECEGCQTPFMPDHGRQRFCDHSCADRSRKRRQRAGGRRDEA